MQVTWCFCYAVLATRWILQDQMHIQERGAQCCLTSCMLCFRSFLQAAPRGTDRAEQGRFSLASESPETIAHFLLFPKIGSFRQTANSSCDRPKEGKAYLPGRGSPRALTSPSSARLLLKAGVNFTHVPAGTVTDRH